MSLVNGQGKCTCIYCALRVTTVKLRDKQEFLILYDQQTSLVTLSASDFRTSLATYYNTRANDMEDSYEVFVLALSVR